ncbi:cadherin domain-containing protein [Microvirga flavescens]|uniref:cadherin domain-containing protein n=1 Tax=Microvirga flavescens TaxID=2249811 RepID=UPI000DD754EE|nr:cadherin domain-containing protein [Microvirga flavescens]
MPYEIILNVLVANGHGLEEVPGDPTAFWVEENVPTNFRLAEITNYDIGAANSYFRFGTLAGETLNAGGRYGLEKDSVTGKWYLTVADGTGFNWEDLTTHEGIRIERVDGVSGAVIDEATIQTYLKDVDENEAPTFSITGATSFAADDNGAAVKPFGGVTLSDTENDELTVTLSFANIDGTLGSLTGTGVTLVSNNASSGIRTVTWTGKALDLQNFFDNLTFDPTNSTASSGSFTTKFSFTVKDGSHTATTHTDAVEVVTTIKDKNTAPTAVKLDSGTAKTIEENNTVIGTLSATDDGLPTGSSLSYSFDSTASGGGNAGGLFIIDNGQIKIATGRVLDYEAGSTYTIYVRAHDGSLYSTTQAITITVTDANDKPHDITFTGGAVKVGDGAGTTVVTAAAVDQDTNTAYRNNKYMFSNGTLEFGNYVIDADTGVVTTKSAVTATGSVTLSIVTYDVSDTAKGTTKNYTFNIGAATNTAPTGVKLDSATTKTIEENNTVIGTLSATDDGLPTGSSLSYSFDATASGGGNASGLFIIDNGQIKIASGRVLDYEAGSTYTIYVKAYDGDKYSTTQAITITVTDANDKPHDITFTGSGIKVGDGAGTTVVTAAAVDQDTNTAYRNNKYMFSNGTLEFGNYVIDKDTGVVTTKGSVSATGSVTLSIVTYDAGDTTKATTKTYTFNIGAAANTAPTNVKLDSATTKTIEENNTVIGTLSATDDGLPTGSSLSYSFDATASGGGNASGLFIIDNGQIKIASGRVLNYEAGSTYTIYVKAYDGDKYSTTQAITITVTDANDAPHDITFTGSGIKVGDGAGTTVVTAAAVDQDTNTAYRNNKYMFSNGTLESGNYVIDKDTGVVTTKSAVTATGSVTLSIVTYDAADTTKATTKTYNFNIGSASNTAPTNVKLDGVTALTLNENTAYEGTLSADDDVAVTGYIFDSTAAGGGNAGGLFVIDGGQIKVASGRVLDYEASASYTIYVKAFDGSLYSATQAITINLTDRNDAPSDLTFLDARTVKAGATKAGAQVVDADFYDQDAQPGYRDNLFRFANGTLTDGIFTINATTGVITVNRDIEAGDAGEKHLDVVVYDRGTETLRHQETYTFTIVAADVPSNNNPGVVNLSAGPVSEYAKVGTYVGTLTAVDPEGTALTYALTGEGANYLSVDASGRLTLKAEVNYEAAKTLTFTVVATDATGLPGPASTFTLNIVDEVTLNKRGKAGNDKLNGTAFDDILKGGSSTGKDVLKGLGGDDKLYGEGGDDQLSGGAGIDRLYGGKGDDVLKGDAGNDFLYGEEGNDKLYGGAGRDTFVFNKKLNKETNFDEIKDFKVTDDVIWLDNKIFKKLGLLGTEDAPAALNKDFFKIGKKAKDKNDYIVYDKQSGILYYDQDGSGKKEAVEIAQLKKNLKLTADHFFVV